MRNVLSKEQIAFLEEKTLEGLSPSMTQLSFFEKYPGIPCRASFISNLRYRLRSEALSGRSAMSAFFVALTNASFVCKLRTINRVVEGLFFAHPMCCKFFSTWGGPLFVDATYKTNRYGMPLVEVVGSTPMNKSYTLAYCFLSAECQSDYEWFLDCLRSALGESKLDVITTDRERALMNAIAKVFPESLNVLCLWHIRRNVVTNCARHFANHSELDDFLG